MLPCYTYTIKSVLPVKQVLQHLFVHHVLLYLYTMSCLNYLINNMYKVIIMCKSFVKLDAIYKTCTVKRV